MAVPKRKTTVSKRNKRRSHHKITNMNVVEDKKTGEYRISHHKAILFYHKETLINNYYLITSLESELISIITNDHKCAGLLLCGCSLYAVIRTSTSPIPSIV